MSKVCALCGKRPVAGNNVSHSKRRTKRRFLPNLVSKKFAGVKIQICTRCLRTLQKPERVRKVAEPKIESEKVAEPEISEKKVAKKSSSKK